MTDDEKALAKRLRRDADEIGACGAHNEAANMRAAVTLIERQAAEIERLRAALSAAVAMEEDHVDPICVQKHPWLNISRAALAGGRAMADRSILFSAPMVRALLDGRKTQTRRVLARARVFATPETPAFTLTGDDLARALQGASNFRPLHGDGWFWEADAFDWQAPAARTGWMAHLGYAPGDRLYVREAWLFDLAHNAITALDRMRGWQDISSAPRDGTRFIAGRFTGKGRNHDGLIQVDYWHSREKGHSYDGLGKFNSARWPATHWMPLPPAPNDFDDPDAVTGCADDALPGSAEQWRTAVERVPASPLAGWVAAGGEEAE